MRRVLLAFPQADGQTGVAIRNAFDQLGWEVVVLDPKIEPELLYSRCSETLPDLVFCSRTPALTNGVAEIRTRLPFVTTCVWNVDVRETIEEWNHLIPLFKATDYYFDVSEYWAGEFAKQVNPNSFWLPQGVQPELYHKPGEILPDDVKRFECDVSFAGCMDGGPTIHGWRDEYLKAVRGMGLNFKHFGDAGNPRVTGEDHNKLAVLSKINLGMSMGLPTASKYQSVRDYKILAAGGFLLTKYCDWIGDWFPTTGSSRGMAFYTNVGDMVDMIRYWLAHDEERERVAQNGYNWVHNGHHYVDRIRRAIEIMEMR